MLQRASWDLANHVRFLSVSKILLPRRIPGLGQGAPDLLASLERAICLVLISRVVPVAAEPDALQKLSETLRLLVGKFGDELA
jgi:hypothetical protein